MVQVTLEMPAHAVKTLRDKAYENGPDADGNYFIELGGFGKVVVKGVIPDDLTHSVVTGLEGMYVVDLSQAHLSTLVFCDLAKLRDLMNKYDGEILGLFEWTAAGWRRIQGR